MEQIAKYQAATVKHTPGPWTAECDPGHYDTLSTVVAGSKRAKPPIEQMCVQVGGFADWQEQEANTRLIAAAPELLAFALAYVDLYNGEGVIDESLLASAKEAISKAIGA